MSYHPGKFIWFEHLSSDPVKAHRFYEALFGWKVTPMPMGEHSYDMIQNGEQRIGGMLKAPPGVPPQWVSYLSVRDVDASYKAALAAGAKSAMEPKDFPPPFDEHDLIVGPTDPEDERIEVGVAIVTEPVRVA